MSTWEIVTTYAPPVHTTYPKIPSPFKRLVDGPNRNKLGREWVNTDVWALKDQDWTWTEKVDGQNIRVLWDGHDVTFAGRSDNAELHLDLIAHLEATFTEEILENVLGETPGVLYGEGFGSGIQKGGAYREDKAFILFDARIGGTWLLRDDVEDIAGQINVPVVPLVMTSDIEHAIWKVQEGFYSILKPAEGGYLKFAEGLVGVPSRGFLDRRGHRIMVKIKHVDFCDEGK